MADLGNILGFSPYSAASDQAAQKGNIADFQMTLVVDSQFADQLDSAIAVFRTPNYPAANDAATQWNGLLQVVGTTGGTTGGTTVDTAPQNIYKVYGNVTELGVAVARNVRIYRRDTGLFLATALSDDITGDFEVDIPDFFGECYAVALDDNSLPNYNALIIDRVTPVSPPV